MTHLYSKMKNRLAIGGLNMEKQSVMPSKKFDDFLCFY